MKNKINILEIPNSPIEVNIADEDILSIRDAELFYEKSQILGLHDGEKCLECGFKFTKHKSTGTYYTSATSHLLYKHLMSDEQREDWSKRKSEIMTERWAVPGYKEKFIETVKEIYSSLESKQKRSDASKLIWKIPGYRENHIERMINLWKNPEFSEFMSDMITEKWKDPEYRNSVLSSMKITQATPEYKEKLSKSTKKTWEKPGYRENISCKMKSKWQEPGYRDNISTKAIKYWNQDDVKEECRERSLKMHQDPKHKEKLKKIYTDPEYLKMMSEIRIGKPRSGKSIIQYDLKGNFIAEYDKIKKADVMMKKEGKSGQIGQCCKRKKKTACGYIWRYKKDPLTEDEKKCLMET